MQNSERFYKRSGFNVSVKYKPLNTGEIVQAFEGKGLQLTSVQGARVRKAEKDGYQKHILRFRPSDAIGFTKQEMLKGTVPEIVLVNSYDGSTSLKLFMGLFRMVCANGLIAGVSFGVPYRIKHIGDARFQLSQAIPAMLDQVSGLEGFVKRLERRMLNATEQFHFASRAAEMLVPKSAFNLQIQNLLQVRRAEDQHSDAWTVFNRIQETAVRGGLRYQMVRDDGKILNMSTRAIRSIDRNVDVNRQLWDLALEVAS